MYSLGSMHAMGKTLVGKGGCIPPENIVGDIPLNNYY